MYKELKISDYLFLAAGVILLFPIIFFPITTDLAIFIQSGQIISEGGKPYVDFIDIKPPAVYYLFSLVYSLLGNSEFALRLLDFFIQFVTGFLLYHLIKSKTGNTTWAGLSFLFYAVTYTVLAHNQTMQIESWIPLLSLFMVKTAVTENNRKSRLILLGVLAGLITALKLTMLFIVFLIPLADYILRQYNAKDMAKRFLIFLIGFASVIILSLLPFLDGEIRAGFSNVYIYLSMYADFSVMSSEFKRETIKSIGSFAGDKYSLFASFSVIAGIILFIKKFKRNKTESNLLILYSIVGFILLTISVIIEKKFFFYHYSRLYLFLSIFGGFSILFYYNIIKKSVLKNRRLMFIVLCFCLFLFVLSPFPRWISLLQPTYYYLSDKSAYDKYYSRPQEGSAVLRTQHLQTAEYIKSNAQPGDKVLVVSVASSIINYHLGDLANNKYMLSCFYISNSKIQPWRDDALRISEESKWIILQEDDPSMIANMHSLSSRQYYIRDSKFGRVLQENFELADVIGKFYIYKRK